MIHPSVQTINHAGLSEISQQLKQLIVPQYLGQYIVSRKISFKYCQYIAIFVDYRLHHFCTVLYITASKTVLQNQRNNYNIRKLWLSIEHCRKPFDCLPEEFLGHSFLQVKERSFVSKLLAAESCLLFSSGVHLASCI